MGGPDMAPQPPQPSERPGEPVALLDNRRAAGSAADDVGDGAGEDQRVEWLCHVALVAGVGDPARVGAHRLGGQPDAPHLTAFLGGPPAGPPAETLTPYSGPSHFSYHHVRPP